MNPKQILWLVAIPPHNQSFLKLLCQQEYIVAAHELGWAIARRPLRDAVPLGPEPVSMELELALSEVA